MGDKHFFVEDDIQADNEKLDIKLVGIKKIDFQKDRYKYFKDYKIDRWLIQLCMLLCFGYLLFIAWSYDFNMDYFSCKTMDLKGCENPFYKETTWKNYEYLPTGEYGQKPGPLFNSAWPVTILIFVLGFGLNHYGYNRGRIKWKSLLNQ